jgi:hypothetical protein
LHPFKDQSERRSSGSAMPAQGGPRRMDTVLKNAKLMIVATSHSD